MKYLLLLLLISCSYKVETTDGIIEFPNSVIKNLISKSFIRTYEDTREHDCSYSGFCMWMGEYGYHFNCSGSRFDKERHSVYSVVYSYNHNKVYTGKPVIEEDTTSISHGECE